MDDEALLAEDLAIRFADRTASSRAGWPYGRDGYSRVRDQCMATLFGIVGRRYGVTPDDVRRATAHRPWTFDAVVLISFASIYALIVSAIVRRVLSGGLSENSFASGLAIGLTSIVLAALAFLPWRVWSGLAESIRLGNGHVSYRDGRIPWRHHPVEFAIGCLVVFWFVAIAQALSKRRRHGGGCG